MVKLATCRSLSASSTPDLTSLLVYSTSASSNFACIFAEGNPPSSSLVQYPSSSGLLPIQSFIVVYSHSYSIFNLYDIPSTPSAVATNLQTACGASLSIVPSCSWQVSPYPRLQNLEQWWKESDSSQSSSSYSASSLPHGPLVYESFQPRL